MTWGDVGAFFVVIVVGGLIAGFVDAWLEQRKWDKKTKKGGRDLWSRPPGWVPYFLLRLFVSLKNLSSLEQSPWFLSLRNSSGVIFITSPSVIYY